jgi:hypothetical protein
LLQAGPRNYRTHGPRWADRYNACLSALLRYESKYS